MARDFCDGIPVTSMPCIGGSQIERPLHCATKLCPECPGYHPSRDAPQSARSSETIPTPLAALIAVASRRPIARRPAPSQDLSSSILGPNRGLSLSRPPLSGVSGQPDRTVPRVCLRAGKPRMRGTPCVRSIRCGSRPAPRGWLRTRRVRSGRSRRQRSWSQGHTRPSLSGRLT